MTSDSTLSPWPVVRLKEVAQVVGGIQKSPDRLPRKHHRPYVTVRNVQRGWLDFSHVERFEVSEAELERLRLRADDLLIVEGNGSLDHIGRSALFPQEHEGEEWIHQNHVIRVRLHAELILPAFVDLFLRSPVGTAQVVERARTTSGLYTLSVGKVESLLLPMPDRGVQERTLQELLPRQALVDRARAAAEAQLKTARELAVAAVDDVFRSKDAETWPRLPLGEVLHLRKEVVHPKDAPRGRAVFVGLEHIESHTGRRTGSVEVEMEKLTGRKPCFRKGDIVYGYLRPYLNKVWVAEFSGLCSVDQYVYRVDENSAIPSFVASFMRTPSYLRAAPVAGTPGQLPRIRTEEVSRTLIPLPPLPKQSTVLRVIEQVRGECERLTRAAKQQLGEIANLPAALLRQAFSGALR